MSSGGRFTASWLESASAGASASASSSSASASAPVGFSFFGSATGDAEAGAGATGDDDSGGGAGEASSFLPSFVRSASGGLFGGTPPPPPPEWACGLTLAQRLQVGAMLLLGAFVLFTAALFVFLPMVLLFPAKFAAAFSCGSLLAMAAMALFRGPRTTLLGLLERERIAFTAAYLGSLALTLYASLAGQSYFLVVFAVAVQVAALLYYASSFVPGGTTGMNFVTRMALAGAFSGARGVLGFGSTPTR